MENKQKLEKEFGKESILYSINISADKVAGLLLLGRLLNNLQYVKLHHFLFIEWGNQKDGYAIVIDAENRLCVCTMADPTRKIYLKGRRHGKTS